MYKTIATISTDDFIAVIDKLPKVKGRKLHWYKLILNNNLICPATNDSVAYCGYDMNIKNNTYHFNFYGKNGELFTIDHKMPLSLGGEDNIHNVQPMMAKDNWDKGSKLLYL